MRSDEVRKKYIDFFKGPPRSHKEISPAPLVLENDPTTLFTSSGMQPLIPYLMGEPHPEGKRLVNSQPSIRLQDIDEVGDNRHTTFFEMLGNWSLGDYWKKEQLGWFWEFLTSILKLPKERLWVSVFEGNDNVSKDEESAEIWKKLGVSSERIVYCGVDKNWWSRSGTPDKMPEGEIGGPDSEVFFEFPGIKHDPKYGAKCHPNCDCGRFLEIGNSVFIQYKKEKDGSLEELPQKNVDFGGGLERIVAATLDEADIFKTEVFEKKVLEIERISTKKYDDNKRSIRIIADHMRAVEALIKDAVVPSNKMQGYVLRRLIRRSAVKMRSLKGSLEKTDLNLAFDKKVDVTVEAEVERFSKTLEKGLREIEKIEKITGAKAFDLYQTYGFPVEITEEIFKEKGQEFDKKIFEEEFKKHQKKSRSASTDMFKGGLADHSEEVTRLHTTTHLLHAALRKVLGEHVEQKGSNITVERLRFDFSHPEKLTDDQIKEVENLVNEQIDKDLPVSFETKTYKAAVNEGALAFFGSKYGEKVKVYTIGDPNGSYFSKEVCAGPHVANTGEIGHVRIKKQEKIGSGLVRLYASIE
jgi:alanyl-tRNA synthetase